MTDTKSLIREIEKIIDNPKDIKEIRKILSNYMVKKNPKQVCSQCIHYHKYGPGEIFSPNPVNIIECYRGHDIHLFAADNCPDFLDWKGFRKSWND